MGQTLILYLFIFTIFFVILISSTEAIQDVNITIDPSGLDLCLTADGLSNQVCDLNHTLVLDGTQDHILYFTPRQLIGSNATVNSWAMVYDPIVLLFTGNMLYVIFFMLIMVYLFIKVIIR